MNTFNLTLDLDKEQGLPQVVTLRQGDKMGTQLVATIYDHGQLVGGGYTARVSLRHPGSGKTYYRETAILSNGVATVTVDEQRAATVAGVTTGYFELLQGSTVKASTADFIVRILPSAEDGAVPGSVYDSAIQDALDELDAATGRISQMVVDATAEYLAAHPEITTTVQDNSVTDAKLIQSGGVLDRVGRLWWRLENLLTNTPAEADVVTVHDAAKTPLAGLALYGRSTQDGTPTPSAPVAIQSVGPNLYHQTHFAAGVTRTINGIDVTYNADGTVTASGTATSTTWLWGSSNSAAEDYYVTLPAGTYTVCGSHYVAVQTMVDGTVTTIVSSGTFGHGTFTLAAPTLVKAAPVIHVGDTVDAERVWVAVYEGDVQQPYVPYGHVGLRALGGNLSPFFSVAPVMAGGYWMNANSYWTPTEDGWARFTRSSEAQVSTDIAIAAQPWLEVGKTYTLMLEWRDVTVSGTVGMYHSGSDDRQLSTTSSTFAITAGSGSSTVRVTGDHAASEEGVTKLIHWRVRNNAGSSVDGEFRLSIYEGDYTGGYQPYVESTTAIPTGGHVLRSLPDGTRDEVTVDEYGHVILTQRVGSYTVTGSETVDNGTQLGTCRRVRLPNALPAGMGSVNDASSGWCTATPFSGGYSTDSPHLYTHNRNVYAFVGVSTDSAALAALTGATILYPLATPQTVDLGTIDPTALVGPDMTAHAVPTAPFALTYERDLNATLARLEAALATLA